MVYVLLISLSNNIGRTIDSFDYQIFVRILKFPKKLSIMIPVHTVKILFES